VPSGCALFYRANRGQHLLRDCFYDYSNAKKYGLKHYARLYENKCELKKRGCLYAKKNDRKSYSCLNDKKNAMKNYAAAKTQRIQKLE
jgi:hypothetical protein